MRCKPTINDKPVTLPTTVKWLQLLGPVLRLRLEMVLGWGYGWSQRVCWDGYAFESPHRQISTRTRTHVRARTCVCGFQTSMI